MALFFNEAIPITSTELQTPAVINSISIEVGASSLQLQSITTECPNVDYQRNSNPSIHLTLACIEPSL